MSKFNDVKVDGSGALDSYLFGTCFTFICVLHYVFDGVAHYVYWCIHCLVWYFVWVVAKHERGGGATAVFW